MCRRNYLVWLLVGMCCVFAMPAGANDRTCISDSLYLQPENSDCNVGYFHVQPPAVEYAFTKSHWHEYAEYVQSITSVWVSGDGGWIIETKFSNGHRTAKKTMGTSIAVVDGDGKCLFGAVHEVNLDPSFGGSANEYISRTTGSIPVEELGLISDTNFSASGLTQHSIDRFNAIRPYGLTLPNGQKRACGQ